MTLYKLIKSDALRYSAYSKKKWFIEIVINRGLWATIQYRIAHAIYVMEISNFVKKPLLITMVTWQYFVEWFTTIKIPYTCKIGEGLYIGHPNNVILNGKVELGKYCNISQGVTIGVSGRGLNRGVPKIGNFVYFGANSVVAGKIEIGDESIISANSLVNLDAPKNSLLIGVPANVITNKSSLSYILPVA